VGGLGFPNPVSMLNWEKGKSGSFHLSTWNSLQMSPEKLDPSKVQIAADLVKSARHLVVFTGAGISTASGIPDFRSQGTGLWTKNDPMEAASLTSFLRRPEKFFDWLRPLLNQTWNARPNPAHQAIAEMESRGLVKAVITQNIDGLHRLAGSKNVIEIHGSLDTMECLQCRARYPSTDFRDWILEPGGIPKCPRCGRAIKPAIVLFEEFLPPAVWRIAEEECARADLMLVIGSSLVVMPAAGLPYTTLQNGGRLVINTYSTTPLDGLAEIRLPYPIAETIPAINQATLK